MDCKLPIDYSWNFPLLATPKLTKEKEQPDNILYINVRFFNDKIIIMIDSNLLLLKVSLIR
jgi:hypothetical protein